MAENYLRMLIESQEKKLRLLKEAERLDEEMMNLMLEENPDLEKLEKNLAEKGKIVGDLDALDDGFEAVYGKIRDELAEHKELYREEIRKLKEQISDITEETVKIRAMEERNRAAVEKFFADRKKKLREGKSSVKIANAYAMSMRRVNQVDSFFVDKKK